ncbi:hypothetical protein RSPO_c02412 [Ralstonia solanacearum Po82]|uniref:Uncharacterized protein n=1 Tax=Ralstonia solanacearum (strain Po82) TaxID=1031711 RepID=F6G3E0_RALS8|nr:hypothetical protein RSPO_c02412 [Ralstonia solanacearum Po82]
MLGSWRALYLAMMIVYAKKRAEHAPGGAPNFPLFAYD